MCDFSALLSLCMDYNLIYQFSTLNPKFFRLQFLKSVCQYFWLKVTKTQKIVTQNFSYDKTWSPVKPKNYESCQIWIKSYKNLKDSQNWIPPKLFWVHFIVPKGFKTSFGIDLIKLLTCSFTSQISKSNIE